MTINADIQKILQHEVENKMLLVRGQQVLLDADVAALYGLETKVVKQAVRRNAEKFPEGYIYNLDNQELANLRSQFVTSRWEQIEGQKGNLRTQIATSSWGGSRYAPIVFTEKGLYMLATVLRSERALAATFAIIETFATVRQLKRDLVELHHENDPKQQQTKIKRFGQKLTDIVMPDLDTTDTESSLEINFIIGKIKHTVKRSKKK